MFHLKSSFYWFLGEFDSLEVTVETRHSLVKIISKHNKRLEKKLLYFLIDLFLFLFCFLILEYPHSFKALVHVNKGSIITHPVVFPKNFNSLLSSSKKNLEILPHLMLSASWWICHLIFTLERSELRVYSSIICALWLCAIDFVVINALCPPV